MKNMPVPLAALLLRLEQRRPTPTARVQGRGLGGTALKPEQRRGQPRAAGEWRVAVSVTAQQPAPDTTPHCVYLYSAPKRLTSEECRRDQNKVVTRRRSGTNAQCVLCPAREARRGHRRTGTSTVSRAGHPPRTNARSSKLATPQFGMLVLSEPFACERKSGASSYRGLSAAYPVNA